MKSRLLIVVALLIVLSPSGGAQQRWDWPERAQNLQVLPKDFPKSNLRAVMTEFTRRLGVRCSHCHVGQEGQPLSTYDFVSDENPNKATARLMLKMLGSIDEQLEQVEPTGPKRVNMWCGTCHRGRPRPTTLTEEMTEQYEKGGIAAAVDHYRELRRQFYGKGAYDFSENVLNSLGYQLLRSDKAEDAIRIFRLNVEYFPDSGNVYDSLAEAYAQSGKREQAVVFYRKSLEINPDNTNAVEKLKQLAAQ